MTRQSVEEYKVKNGDAFRTNTYANVAAGDTLTLHISNVSDSVDAVITGVKITCVGPYEIRKPINFDVSAGNSITVNNRLYETGESRDTVMNAHSGSTYTNEETRFTEYHGKDDTQPGSASNSYGESSDDPVGDIAPEGDFLVEVYNRSADTAHDASITVEYYESR